MSLKPQVYDVYVVMQLGVKGTRGYVDTLNLLCNMFF